MKEIEVLFPCLSTLHEAKYALNQFEFIGSNHTVDTYYYDPLRSNLKPNKGKIFECFRLRNKAGKAFLTYKIDRYNDDEWLYSDENEISIGSEADCKAIISSLGLEVLVVVDNTKHTYLSDTYEIVIEEVTDLGVFIEVELRKAPVDVDSHRVKNQIRKFVESLGLTVGIELNSGKPELLLNAGKGAL